MGTSEEIYNKCGCHPYDQRVNSALQATTLTQLIKIKVLKCVSAKASIDIKLTDFKGDVQSCYEQDTTLDPDIKKTLDEVVLKSMDHVTPEEVTAYTKCVATIHG